MYDRCGQAQFEIYKINTEIWNIESRYRRPDGTVARMSPHDARRMRELLKFLQKWEDYQKKLGCVPGKAW
jgi:hypothetical protein